MSETMDVLIVDDERTALKNLTRVLKKVVPDAVIAETDEADGALKLCRENIFDVVFLDINMPIGERNKADQTGHKHCHCDSVSGVRSEGL